MLRSSSHVKLGPFIFATRKFHLKGCSSFVRCPRWPFCVRCLHTYRRQCEWLALEQRIGLQCMHAFWERAAAMFAVALLLFAQKFPGPRQQEIWSPSKEENVSYFTNEWVRRGEYSGNPSSCHKRGWALPFSLSFSFSPFLFLCLSPTLPMKRKQQSHVHSSVSLWKTNIKFQPKVH